MINFQFPRVGMLVDSLSISISLELVAFMVCRQKCTVPGECTWMELRLEKRLSRGNFHPFPICRSFSTSQSFICLFDLTFYIWSQEEVIILLLTRVSVPFNDIPWVGT